MTDETAAPYHHGDLRSVLIAQAALALESGGVGKLSLRKLAAAAGVSHNAPYMHFRDKAALLDGVAAQGFADVGHAIAEAGGRHAFTEADWRPRMKAGLLAYIAFAQARPALYALMHQPKPDGDGISATAGQQTLAALQRALEAGQLLGHVRADDGALLALWVWTTLHGLAGLTGSARLAFGGRSPDAVAEDVLDALLDGLKP
ncbi:MAG: WHG domain-containing protein [Devosiaceae bacterium]|nr:WHG domain-containing protein [Devosiaceae bacterium MH13]